MTETPRGWGVTPSTGIPTIAFGNQKGGTGKTTATINSAAALATRNHDVLAIDMDPQADMTKGLGLGQATTTILQARRTNSPTH